MPIECCHPNLMPHKTGNSCINISSIGMVHFLLEIFNYLVLFCSVILVDSENALDAIFILFSGRWSLLKYKIAVSVLSNRKVNVAVTGTRKNPINQSVVVDINLEENEASFVHMWVPFVSGIGGVLLPKLFCIIRDETNHYNSTIVNIKHTKSTKPGW